MKTGVFSDTYEMTDEYPYKERALERIRRDVVAQVVAENATDGRAYVLQVLPWESRQERANIETYEITALLLVAGLDDALVGEYVAEDERIRAAVKELEYYRLGEPLWLQVPFLSGWRGIAVVGELWRGRFGANPRRLWRRVA